MSADTAMDEAKRQFTRAAQAVIDGDGDAVELCTAALRQIAAAQAEIVTDRELDELAVEIGVLLDQMDDPEAFTDELVRALESLGGEDGHADR